MANDKLLRAKEKMLADILAEINDHYREIEKLKAEYLKIKNSL